MSRLLDWLDHRIGYRALLRAALLEPVPGGARLHYVFGSVLVYLFVQQIVLGTVLAAYYSPSSTAAWASTAYLQDQVSLGWFVRGLHAHSSSAMIIALACHSTQVVLSGAYRGPREVTWWTGLALAALVAAFALTGYLLPWDQKGYWATQVATSILGSIPGGVPLQELLQGGSDYGSLTLTRFYALHVIVLPLFTIALLVGHVALFRRHGVTPRASAGESELKSACESFWPRQVLLDTIAMGLTAGLLVAWTIQTHGVELAAPADPSSSFPARPEWYFLFLFQWLKIFEGPWVLLGTVFIPVAVIVFLLALPFLDRASERRAGARWRVLSVIACLWVGIGLLTLQAVKADGQDKELQGAITLARERGEQARALALLGVPPEGGIAVWENDPSFRARRLFEAHCSLCHAIHGEGGGEAPDLGGFGARDWLSGAIREPRSTRYFGGTKAHETMTSYGKDVLSDEQVAALVEYLVALRADPMMAADSALATAGKALWDAGDPADCSGCHPTNPGADGGGAPTFAGRGTAQWIARVVRDSSAPDLYGAAAEMPKFAGVLEEFEIADLAAWLAKGSVE